MPREFTIDATWSARPCPACRTPAGNVLFHKEDVPFVESVSRRTVYVNPAPPASLLWSVYDKLGAEYFTGNTKLALDSNPKRYWRELPAMPREMRRGRLLDVGCATGSLLSIRSRFAGTAVDGT